MDSPSPLPADGQPLTLAQLIKATRTQRGLDLAGLANPEFTVDYIAAVEAAAVPVSLPVLAYLAPRLALPLEVLLAAPQVLGPPIHLGAVAEDLRYQAHLALRAIRAGQPEAGLRAIDAAAAYIRPYFADVPSATRYLISFVRGRAYYQQGDFALARAALAEALPLAAPDPEATVTTRNLLGAVLCQQEQPQQALEHHLRCRQLLQAMANPDLNHRVSVQRNLANDYLALHDLPQAIESYKEALRLLEDLDDPDRRASVLWGLLMACRSAGDGPQAKVYGLQALRIYEERDQVDDAAAVCLNLAEIFLDEGRYAEAEQMLKRAKWFLRDTKNPGLLSYLAGDFADLTLRQGQLDSASRHAAESIQYAEAFYEAPADPASLTVGYPTRAYADALQVAALVEEAKGNADEADQFFARALDLISQTAFDDASQAIQWRYAEVLKARGAFERSAAYYRNLATFRPRSRQGGMR